MSEASGEPVSGLLGVPPERAAPSHLGTAKR